MAGMDAGSLDRRVEILRGAPVDDGISTSTGEPAVIGIRWAARTDVSDRERLIASQQGAELTTRFIMRWDSLTATITADDQLREDGTMYQIIGKPKQVGRREGIEISACSI